MLRTRPKLGVIASVSAEGGYIFGFGGEKIRATDNFFLGGTSLRGFKAAGVGPRDTLSADALGGNQYFAGTVQMSFPLGLPEEYKIRGRSTKYLLKKALCRYLPPELVYRPKQGFGVPQADWLRTVLRERMEACLARTRSGGWFRTC